VLVALAGGLYVAARRAAWRLHDDHLAATARSLAAIAEFDRGYELELPRDLELDVPAHFDLTLPDGRDGRAVALRFVPRVEPGQHADGTCTIVVAAGDEEVAAVVAGTRTWFVALAALGLLAIAAATAWSLARGLRPHAELARAIERVDDATLGTPITVPDPPAELAAPIAKLNELLARLGEAFARERRFTADVSHELRTPLAGLRSILEVSALAERSTAEYKQAIADARAIVVQLGEVIEMMLTLARLDAGHVDVAKADVPLRRLVDECWQPHAEHAAARGLSFANAVPDAATARTDREKLRVVVANLLSNAAEYTTERGWIEVTSGDGALLDVVDSGPPIPAEQIEHVFDRLWRGDNARTATGVHCGVGLALARALCERLGLALSAATRDDGSVRFRVATPR